MAEEGIPWLIEDAIPTYGMLGMLVAYAKVGKTTFGHAMGAAVSVGGEFIGRKTRKSRVLYIAAEDPPEYTDYLARHIVTDPEAMTFYQGGVILNDEGLARIAATIKAGDYGFVLIASWQAVIRGLVKDENDNAAAVVVVERVKVATRETKVPWLIDAHSGRGEDQGDEADPIKALRGASGAAGAADYILSLRYADGAFGNKRRVSGRGRFVTLAPQTIAFDPSDGTYQDLGSTKDANRDTTWRLIVETGAVVTEPRSVDAIARASGLVGTSGKVGGQARKHVREALHGRPGIIKTEKPYRAAHTRPLRPGPGRRGGLMRRAWKQRQIPSWRLDRLLGPPVDTGRRKAPPPGAPSILGERRQSSNAPLRRHAYKGCSGASLSGSWRHGVLQTAPHAPRCAAHETRRIKHGGAPLLVETWLGIREAKWPTKG